MSLGKWKLSTDTTWRNSGSVELPEATYIVQFDDIDGYIPPGQEIVELTEDKTIVGVYYQQLFELMITSNIDDYEWVYWRLSSDPDNEYESMVPVKLQPGQYTIEFLPIEGYVEPNPITILLTKDEIITVEFLGSITVYTYKLGD